jgi:hypothetical protein
MTFLDVIYNLKFQFNEEQHLDPIRAYDFYKARFLTRYFYCSS